MCISSSSSFFSNFLLALVCFIVIWNYSKIKHQILKKLLRHIPNNINNQ